MTKTLSHMARYAAIVGLVVVAAPSLMMAQSFQSLMQRAQRLNDIYDVERLHEAYSYQQDNLLFEDQADLFANGPGVEVHFQHGVWEGKEGARRLWTGHWGAFSHSAFMPVYGALIDHRQAQLVVDISRDGKSAKLRARTLFDFGAQYHTIMKDPTNTNISQSVIYENEYVKQDGIWKLKVWRLCVYAEGSMGTGYADLPPVPGKLGNVANAPHDDSGLLRDVPEKNMALFPGNPIGPDRMETPEEYGCFIAKNQAMSHSLLVPFHYPNPVTGKPVTWVNK